MSKAINVTLYKGRRVFDANGNDISEKTTVKLVHGTTEYKSFLANLLANGVTSFQINSILNLENEELANAYKQVEDLKRNPNYDFKVLKEWEYKIHTLKSQGYPNVDMNDFNKISNEFRLALNLAEEKIAEDLIIDAKPKKEVVKKAPVKKEVNKANIREEFKELYGQYPSDILSDEKIIEAINKKK
jgi:hypothetical protein